MGLFARFFILMSCLNGALAAPSLYSNATTPSQTSFPPAITSASSICNVTTLEAYQIYRGYSTDPALECYCVTQLDNWLQTSDPPTRTLTRSIGTGAFTTTIVSSGTTTTETNEAVLVLTATVTGNFAFADGNYWPGSATSPCCSSCTVAAATVNLFYWPTPAVPSAATSFVSDNYTFVSPSVYIGFTALSAFDLCGQVGNAYTSTTVAFAPGELSSISPIPTLTETNFYYSIISSNGQLTTSTTTTAIDMFFMEGPATAINYEDLGQNCSSMSGYSYVPGNPSQTDFQTYDPCHPTILLPSRVQSLDPAWVSCVNNGIGGFYDPPYALTSVAALLPATSTVPASPASTFQSVVAPTSALSDVAPTSPTFSAPPQDPTASGVQPPGSSTTAQAASTNLPPSNPTNSGNVPSSQGSPGAGPPSHGQTSAGPVSQSLPPIIIGTSTITPNSASQYIIGSQTLSAGGPAITTAGTTYSLAPPASNGALVINGVTITPQPQPPTTTITGAALVIGGSTITANPASQFVVGSQTLGPGGTALTIDGSTFSLPATGSVVVVNGVTTALATVTYTSSIANGGGGSVTGSGTAGVSSLGTSQIPVTLTTNTASSLEVVLKALLAVVVAMVGALSIYL